MSEFGQFGSRVAFRQEDLLGFGPGNGVIQTGKTSHRSLADPAWPALVVNSLCRGQEKRTMRESEGRFPMTKLRITITAFFLLLGALAFASAQPASTKNTVLTNRIGPSGGELFLANGDGSGEHKLNSGGNMDYDAMFSTDGKWIVFTSERNGSANIYRIHADGSGLERLTDDDGFDDQASLSPDDNQLAVVSTRGNGKTK